MTVRTVAIRENSWLARLAAKRLGYAHLAIVIGRTIHLYNTPKSHFMNSRRWLLHELKHVEQFEDHGFFGFLWKYVLEYSKKGYYQNKFEVEARMAEGDEGLLRKYEIRP